MKGRLRRMVAPPHDDAPVLDMAQLDGRRGRVDDPAVVLVTEESDVDAIIAAASAERVAVGALAGREAEYRHRRLPTDFLDQFGPRRRQSEARKPPRQRLGQRRRLVRRDRRGAEKRGCDLRLHAEIDRSGEVLPGIDVPRRGAGQDFPLPLDQLRLNRLIAAGFETPNERAAPLRSEHQGRAVDLAPIAAPCPDKLLHQQRDGLRLVRQRRRAPIAAAHQTGDQPVLRADIARPTHVQIGEAATAAGPEAARFERTHDSRLKHERPRGVARPVQPVDQGLDRFRFFQRGQRQLLQPGGERPV